MIRRDTIYLLELLLLIYLLYVLYKKDNPRGFKVEYMLEIVNQDSVKLRSVISDTTYTIHIDSIQGVLIQDNL
jgi:hypothetical protein